MRKGMVKVIEFDNIYLDGMIDTFENMINAGLIKKGYCIGDGDGCGNGWQFLHNNFSIGLPYSIWNSYIAGNGLND